jgi:hypothetical protein
MLLGVRLDRSAGAHIKIVGNQARLVGRLFLDTQAGRDAFTMLKGLGELAEFSWSLDDIKSHTDRDREGNLTRFITSVKVREISPVLQAASVGTQLVSLKGRRSGLTRRQRDELKAIRENLIRDKLADIKQANKDAMHREAVKAELGEYYEQWLRATGIPYSQDRSALVPRQVKESAWRAVGAFAPDLNLDPADIGIRWFSVEDFPEDAEFFEPRPLLGKCYPKAEPDVIWLHSGLSEGDCWAVVAHELKHLAGGDENEAVTYEQAARLEALGWHEQ